MCAYTSMYNFKSLSHSSRFRCLFTHTFQPFYYLLPNTQTTSSNVGKELRFLQKSKPSTWKLNFNAKLVIVHSKWLKVWLTFISFFFFFGHLLFFQTLTFDNKRFFFYKIGGFQCHLYKQNLTQPKSKFEI